MPQGLGVSRLLFDVRGRGCVSTVALMGVIGQPVLKFTLQDHATSVGCASFRTAGSFLDASGPGGVQIAF